MPGTEFSSLQCDDLSPATKYCRLCYDSDTKTLVTKALPSPEHEIVTASLQILIAFQLHSMELDDEVDCLNSTMIGIGNWKKEVDCCWAPAAQNTKLSFVLEVGLWESSRRLTMDAQGWLETRGTSVNLVVTIEIDRVYPIVNIHQWELGKPICSASTRAAFNSTRFFPGRRARRTATIMLSLANGVISAAGESYPESEPSSSITQLELPFEKVVARLTNSPLERNIIISEQDLRKLAGKIWRKQGRI